LFKKPNGEKYQLKMSRTLSSTFFDDKLPATLQVNAFLCVNFFNPITREYICTRHRDAEQSLKKPSLGCIVRKHAITQRTLGGHSTETTLLTQ
jgi:hypothetical protein